MIYKNEYGEDEIDNDIDESYIDIIKKLKKYNNNVLLSATIDKQDGYEFYGKNIRDMIIEGYICDYNVIVPIFNEISITIEKKSKYLIENHDQIIIFCASRKEGNELKKVMNKLMSNCADYIDCETNQKTRNSILNKFKNGKLPFLINVNILTESFDASNCKGVCFFSLPSSFIKIIQIIGRALRLHLNKTFAKIILPASCENDSRIINKFLNIIAKNDSRIMKSLTGKKRGGYIEIFNSENEICDEKEMKDDSEYLYDIILEKTYDPEYKADLLIEFVEENNRVPKKTEEYKDFKIGQFWGNIKQGTNKELYGSKLKNNSILKEDYNRIQQIKVEKEGKETLTIEQKAELLIEFVEENNRVYNS